jgi:L-ascorbate metabolism protein UlaG (beta-lactamase superfamily)
MKMLITAVILGVMIMAIHGASRALQEEAVLPRQHAAVMNSMTVKEHLQMYREFFFVKGEKVPRGQLPQMQLALPELLNNERSGLKVSWLGHSSLLMQIDGYSILTDPVFERKVSLIGPSRFSADLPLSVYALQHVDVVIVSHDHYDHLNKFSVQQLVDKTGVFIVPLKVGKRLIKWGVPKEKIVELGWWDEAHPQSGLKIAATPAQHFSGRGLFDRNSTLWASWVIETGKHKVFFSGDTGYFDGFKEIGKKYGPFDVAFLECGAYNEHWSNVHMFPEQTVQAGIDLGARVLQPIHWATFNLAMHAWYEPVERLTEAAWNRSVKLSIPVMGQVVDYHKPGATELWWLEAMVESKGAGGDENPALGALQPSGKAQALTR